MYNKRLNNEPTKKVLAMPRGDKDIELSRVIGVKIYIN